MDEECSLTGIFRPTLCFFYHRTFGIFKPTHDKIVDIYTIGQQCFNIFNLLKIYWAQMNRIKEVLKERGISQTWLAKQLGKSYNTINEYSRNVRQPSLEDLYRIAKILDVNAKDLLKEE